jgi:DNA repair protein RadC
MNAQQMHMFPSGGDMPLFSGTPITAQIDEFKPSEVKPTPRLFVCPTCQDAGIVKPSGKTKAKVFCGCPAGQTAKAHETLKALPESKRLQRLREMYAEPSEDTKVLRESLVIDSPERRIVNLGPQALNLIELVSIVLGTPTDPLPATHLLAQLKTLPKVKARSVKELVALGHGITQSRAQRLLAALELGERLREPTETPMRIQKPADVADLLHDMAFLEQEQMRVVLLDTKNNVIDTSTIYTGSVNTTVIRVAELMRAAVRTNATAMLIAHNHPSGDPTPSPEDVAVTREIVIAAKMLDIDCLDHVVIGNAGKFISLKERGLGFGT